MHLLCSSRRGVAWHAQQAKRRTDGEGSELEDRTWRTQHLTATASTISQPSPLKLFTLRKLLRGSHTKFAVPKRIVTLKHVRGLLK